MLLKESIGTMNIENVAFQTIWTIIGVATGTFIVGPILSSYLYRWAFVKIHPYKIMVGDVKNKNNKTQKPSEEHSNEDHEAHAHIEAHSNGAYTHENPAHEAQVHEAHAHEDQVNEAHAHENPAHVVQVHEAHAHKDHTHEAHALLEININKAGKDAAREPGGDGQDWEAANQGLNEEEGDVLEVGGKFLDTGQGGKGGT